MSSAKVALLRLLSAVLFLSGFFVFVCITPARGQSVASPQVDNLRAVDGVVRSLMNQRDLPAISVTIMRRGRIVYEAAYGFADRGLKATPSTPFYLASVTKALTGTSLILLEARHKIDLDRPVNDYLHGAKLRSPRWEANAATIRRVADHTGGLTTYSRSCLPDDASCKSSVETAIARYGILFWPPGDHFDYSNLGYGVLGNLVANVAHEPFERFLDHELFRPLQMKSCYLSMTGGLRPGSGRNYDQQDHKPTPVVISDTPGASAARCSTHDLAIFGSFVMNDTLPGQQQILTQAQLRELVTSDSASAGEHYSFGWEQNEINGTPGVFAQGGTYDSFAFLQLVPSEHVAIAVIANTGSAALMSDVMNRIVTPLFPPGRSIVPENGNPSIPPSEHLLGKWNGVVNTWYGDISVRITITPAHEIEIALGGGLGAPERCENTKIEGNHVYCVAHGDLRTPDGPTPPYPIEIELYLHDSALVGAAVTGGYPQLPYWIQLEPSRAEKPIGPINLSGGFNGSTQH